MHTITNGFFPGPAGRLEYILTEPERPAGRAAVLCHPHPLFGGTMHTRIVFHMCRTLADLGLPVLRFQFRGVGQSAGKHDRGIGERDDLRAAATFLRSRYALPQVVGGFSFGAVVAASAVAAGAGPEAERLVAVGLPADRGGLPTDWSWQGPKLLIWGSRDEFAGAEASQAYCRLLPEPKRCLWVDSGDHFLNGHMDQFRSLLTENLDFDQPPKAAPTAP